MYRPYVFLSTLRTRQIVHNICPYKMLTERRKKKTKQKFEYEKNRPRGHSIIHCQMWMDKAEHEWKKSNFFFIDSLTNPRNRQETGPLLLLLDPRQAIKPQESKQPTSKTMDDDVDVDDDQSKRT